jgi:Uma2 family endonuclease
MSLDWEDPPVDGWTTDDLERHRDPGRRRELIDGVIPVGPDPAHPHHAVVTLLGAKLRSICPSEYEVVQGVELRFSRRRSFVPDLQVVFADVRSRHASWLPTREVVVAVEVVAPTSMVMDRITKPALYAAAGIPYYWRVETDGGVEVSTYRLDPLEEVYRQIGEFREAVDVSEPWPIKIQVSELTPPSRPR